MLVNSLLKWRVYQNMLTHTQQAKMTMASNQADGYDLDWVEEPPDDLQCQICFCVARDPQQHGNSMCGKIFCTSCITKHVRVNDTACPSCRRELNLFMDAKSKNKNS